MLAAQFGAGTDQINQPAIFNLDVYYAAFRLPDFLFNLLSYGVLSAAFVPLFVEILKKEGREEAKVFASEILRTILVLIIAVVAVLFVFTPQIMQIFVPGFDAEKMQTTIDLTRILLITPIFFTIGSIGGGIQNAIHIFWGLSLAPIVYNLGIIAGALFLAPQYGVYGVTIGVIVGAFLNMIIQLVPVFTSGYGFTIPRMWFSAKVKEMIKLSIPRVFGMSVTQLSLVVDTIVASTLASGSIAVINFSSNLESLPIGLIGISVAIVSFGTLSSLAVDGKKSEFIEEVANNLRQMLFLLIPLTLGMLTLRFQIVRLLLGRGNFSWNDTILTANTLGVFLGGLVFGGLVFLLARAFYALKDTKTPVIIGIIAVVLNIGMTLTFTKVLSLSTYGLALANSITNIVNVTLLIVFLSKKLKANILDWKEIWKFIFAALVMMLTVQGTKVLVGQIFEKIGSFGEIDTFSELLIQTSAAVAIGIATYFCICRVFHCKDIKKILTQISSRLK